ncbi:MAG: tetratricopeptide repeat protein [Elusimicrobiota bacterium]
MPYIILFISLFCCSILNAEQIDLNALFVESLQTDDNARKKEIREKIIEISPDSAYGYFCKAWLMSINNYSDKYEIIDLYNKAIKLKPDLWVAYNNVAMVYMELKRYGKAISLCNKALKYSDDSKIYLTRGMANGADGRFKDAQNDFDKVIEINPQKAPDAYFFKALVYNDMKEYGMEQYYLNKAKEMGFLPAIEASAKRTVIVAPFKDDYYGVTDKIINSLKMNGYRVVERSELSRVFDEMKLQMSGATEYEYVKTGKILNAGFIIVGSAYKIYKEYIPPPQQNYPPPRNPGEAFGQGLAQGFMQGIQEGKAGTYIYASFRWIDVNTGEVTSSAHDVLISKY